MATDVGLRHLKPPVDIVRSDQDEELIAIVNRNFDPFVRYIEKRLPRGTKDRDARARDIVATALGSLFERCQKGPVVNRTGFWFRSARNLLINDRKHENVVRRKDEAVAYEHPQVPSPEDLVLEQELSEVFWGAVGRLRAKERAVVTWVESEELGYREVVSRLASMGFVVSERQAARYYHQGMDTCQRAMEEYMDHQKKGRR